MGVGDRASGLLGKGLVLERKRRPRHIRAKTAGGYRTGTGVGVVVSGQSVRDVKRVGPLLLLGSLAGELPLVGDVNGDGMDDIITFVPKKLI
jgi:hypothetical protein